jgi:hypothetical protein
MQVAGGGVLPLLRSKFAQPQDIFYINFNIWHKKLVDWQKTYIPSLEALGSYYQVQMMGIRGLLLFICCPSMFSNAG